MQNSAAGPGPHNPANVTVQIRPPLLSHTHTSLFASRIVFDKCVCVCVFLQIVVCNSLSFVLAEGLSRLCHQQLKQGAQESEAYRDTVYVLGQLWENSCVCVCVCVWLSVCVCMKGHGWLVVCVHTEKPLGPSQTQTHSHTRPKPLVLFPASVRQEKCL